MFHKTRIKLTAWYLLIIMFISLSFSFVIYKAATREFERFTLMHRFRIERRLDLYKQFPTPPIFDPDLIKETKQRIIMFLVFVNGTILIFAGGLGYMLAGKTLQPIKKMVDEQNRFISDASHELKTPLTSLKTTMEVSLRDKNLTLKNAKNLISESVGEVNKLQSLSEQLLQLAQYQKPNNSHIFETVSLLTVVKEAVRKVEALAKKKQIEIKNEVKDLKIKGSKYGLVDLFVILLDNAIKYSPNKSTVTLESKKNKGLILIFVKDQGIGIDEKDLPHIFDRFYRTDSARSKDKQGGYGLGLSIAKKIVKAHNGTITVESKLEKGSTFIVRLPNK